MNIKPRIGNVQDVFVRISSNIEHSPTIAAFIAILEKYGVNYSSSGSTLFRVEFFLTRRSNKTNFNTFQSERQQTDSSNIHQQSILENCILFVDKKLFKNHPFLFKETCDNFRLRPIDASLYSGKGLNNEQQQSTSNGIFGDINQTKNQGVNSMPGNTSSPSNLQKNNLKTESKHGNQPRGCTMLLEGIKIVVESSTQNRISDGLVYSSTMEISQPGDHPATRNRATDRDASHVDCDNPKYKVSDVFKGLEHFKDWLIDMMIDNHIDHTMTQDSEDSLRRLCSAVVANIQAKHTITSDTVPNKMARSRAGNCAHYSEIADESMKTWVEMLMTIPGMSEVKALGVVNEYRSLPSLMERYRACQEEGEAAKLLENLSFKAKTGNKMNKIGKAISQKVYLALCSRNPETKL